MNKSEFSTKLKEVQRQYRCARNRLYREYALANSPYQDGDIVRTTKDGKMFKILSLHDIELGEDGLPHCVFRCVQLRADGQPLQNKKIHLIAQAQIKGKIKSRKQ